MAEHGDIDVDVGAVVRRADELLQTIANDPRAVLAAARAVVDSPASNSLERAAFGRVAGVALRDLGELTMAEAMMRTAIADAESGDDASLAAAIRSSLGFLIARSGDVAGALELFDRAEPDLDGRELARLFNHRGVVHFWRGDLASSAASLAAACRLFDDIDAGAAAKARGNLGAVLAQLGRFDEAEVELLRVIDGPPAERLAIGIARQNLGFTALLRGDLPRSLRLHEAAEAEIAEVGAVTYLPRIQLDFARVLLAGGLHADALAMLQRAIDGFVSQGQSLELASAWLIAADVELTVGHPDAAHAAAERAEHSFAEQRRQPWALLARIARLEAACAAAPERAPVSELLAAAAQLDHLQWPDERARCLLVAAKHRALSGVPGAQLVDADAQAAIAAGPPARRILYAHVRALDAVLVGDRRRAQHEIGAGLRTAIASQATHGAIETRAHAAALGHDLVELGARLAGDDGDGRTMLARIEATRIIAATPPTTRPPDDPVIAAEFAALRTVERRLSDPTVAVELRDDLEASRRDHERRIRRLVRTVGGDGGVPRAPFAALATVEHLLCERRLLAHAVIDGQILAVVHDRDGATIHQLGTLDQVTDDRDAVTFALQRLNRANGSAASRATSMALVDELARQLETALIPESLQDCADPLVIVPSGVVGDVPWGLLPSLVGRPVAVNASATGWADAELRRQRRRDAGRRRWGLVAGPGLDHADDEIDRLGALLPDASSLRGEAATSAALVGLLRSCDVVHVACHGEFRSDNPLFSALRLADGRLNAYELEALDVLPDTIVLAACSTGAAGTVPGGALLGFATALTTLGASTVIAPIVPIADAVAIDVVERLHRHLVAGADPVTALAATQMESAGVGHTAAAFIAIGA